MDHMQRYQSSLIASWGTYGGDSLCSCEQATEIFEELGQRSSVLQVKLLTILEIAYTDAIKWVAAK